MATLAQALENLYSDIDAAILSITVSAKTTYKFARRTPEDKELRGIQMMPGRARLYQFNEAGLKVTRFFYTGAQYSGIEVEVPLEIIYPAHDNSDDASWMAAAMSDWSALHHKLLDSTTIVSAGIQARTAWDQPEIISLANDPWFVLRVKITALLHVEQ